MSIINYLRELVSECPYLKEFYQEVSKEDGYSLKEVPVKEPLVKNYINGDSINQFGFMFTTNKACDIKTVENLIDTEFDKHLLLYLKRRLRSLGIKDLDENRKIESIKASLSAEALKDVAGSYTYQINFILNYYEKGE